jgi:hypothetical protein
MQDGATAHTAKYQPINVLNIWRQTGTSYLWLARSPDLNPCNFYLWGNLEDKVSLNNLHTLDEPTQIIHETVASTDGSKF